MIITAINQTLFKPYKVNFQNTWSCPFLIKRKNNLTYEEIKKTRFECGSSTLTAIAIWGENYYEKSQKTQTKWTVHTQKKISVSCDMLVIDKTNTV